MKTTNTTKKSITEIETLIEKEIAAQDEIYDLDRWDRNDIRLGIYKANGWTYDPFPEEDEDAEDEEDEDIEYDRWGEPVYRAWTMADKLREIGMSERDFM